MKQNLKYLLIDDDPDIIEILTGYITDLSPGCEVRGAVNPLDALDLVKRIFAPDIIIVDLNMPQLHGLEVVKKLLLINANFNIIIYSGNLEQLQLVSNIQLGVKGILEKPTTQKDLEIEIERILSDENPNLENYVVYDLAQAQLLSIWPTDIYVMIGKNKFIKLFKNGDEIDHDKVGKMLLQSHVTYVIEAKK
jgi:DNA-binding NtrC family response regulator